MSPLTLKVGRTRARGLIGGSASSPAQISVPSGNAKFGAGEVINYTVYQASGVVNSITAVPSAASGSPSPGGLTAPGRLPT